MSRIPAPSAIVATTTISAVLAICMLGGVGTAAPAGDSVAPISNGTAGTTLASSVAITAASSNVITSASSDDTTLMAGGRATELGDTVALVDAPTALSAPVSVPVPTINLGLAAGAIAAQAAVLSQASFVAPVVAAPAPVVAAAAPAAHATVASAKAVAPAKAVPTRPATPLAVAGTPLQMAHAVALNSGLSDHQWSCLDQLWQRESKFQTTVRNPRSGAYGIPQALPASRMASAGADWRTNPVTQIKWGLSYIDVRYGTPCNAWSHWLRYRWY